MVTRFCWSLLVTGLLCAMISPAWAVLPENWKECDTSRAIKSEILKEKLVEPFYVEIHEISGIVTIEGWVQHSEEVNAIVNATKRVRKVTRVTSNLAVLSLGDTRITSNLQQACTTEFNGCSGLSISVAEGVVTVSGENAEPHTVDGLLSYALMMPGVKKIQRQ